MTKLLLSEQCEVRTVTGWTNISNLDTATEVLTGTRSNGAVAYKSMATLPNHTPRALRQHSYLASQLEVNEAETRARCSLLISKLNPAINIFDDSIVGEYHRSLLETVKSDIVKSQEEVTVDPEIAILYLLSEYRSLTVRNTNPTSVGLSDITDKELYQLTSLIAQLESRTESPSRFSISVDYSTPFTVVVIGGDVTLETLLDRIDYSSITYSHCLELLDLMSVDRVTSKLGKLHRQRIINARQTTLEIQTTVINSTVSYECSITNSLLFVRNNKLIRLIGAGI